MSTFFIQGIGPIEAHFPAAICTTTFEEAISIIENDIVPSIDFLEDMISIYELPLGYQGRVKLVWRFSGEGFKDLKRFWNIEESNYDPGDYFPPYQKSLYSALNEQFLNTTKDEDTLSEDLDKVLQSLPQIRVDGLEFNDFDNN